MKWASLGLSILMLATAAGAVGADGKAARLDAGEAGAVVLVSNAHVAVTRADFDAEMTRIPDADRPEFLSSRERIGKVLEDLLLTKTLAREGREIGLDRTPLIRKKMELAQERVLASERFEHLIQEVKLPDFEKRAKEIYRLNPEKYTTKTQMRASHILVAFKARSKEAALKQAQEVHALAMSGSDFGELAARYSDDPGSKSKQGDLGFFTAEAMVKQFSVAAFALKPGEISAPVETQFGYHVIKALEVKPGARQSFDEVKAAIMEELKAQYLADYKVAHRTQIRADKDIKINEEQIEKIKTASPAASVGNKP